MLNNPGSNKYDLMRSKLVVHLADKNTKIFHPQDANIAIKFSHHYGIQESNPERWTPEKTHLVIQSMI